MTDSETRHRQVQLAIPRQLAKRITHGRMPYDMKQTLDEPKPAIAIFGPCPTLIEILEKGSPLETMGSGIKPLADMVPVTVTPQADNTLVIACRWCHRASTVTDGDLIDWLANTGEWNAPQFVPATTKEKGTQP